MDFPAWDPVLLDLWGPIDIRWYGMMYVVGFVFGQLILVRLARAGFFPVKSEVAPDLVFYLVFGVMLGGRVGYALFYDNSLLNPLQFVQVWKGGLAFHGGLAGVGIATLLFCRRHNVSWRRTADACAFATTPGIFAVRMGNFINGELYGRPTEKGDGWAMQFPTDPVAGRLLGIPDGCTMRDRELCIQVAFDKREFDDIKDQLSEMVDGQLFHWDQVAEKLDWAAVSKMTDANGELLVRYRHPSQVYEGFGEGLLLGLVLFGLYLLTRRRPWPHGYYAVVFLLGYASIRWSLEFVRQPDAQFFSNGHNGIVLLGMTMGQTLSVGLVLGAVLILFWPRWREPAGRA